MKNTARVRRLITAVVIMAAFVAALPAAAGGNVTEFNVDGLKVILKQVPKEVVSVSLFVEGGTTNYPKEQEGIELLAYEFVLDGGTESMDRTAFSGAVEKTGTQFSTDVTFDYGALNMNCAKMFWDRSWDLFADAVMNPAFDETEFARMKDQIVTLAKQNQADPDNHLRSIAMKSTFGGTAYENIPGGSPEALEALTLEEVKDFYNSVVGKKRAFLVVVGDVDKKDLESKVKASLAKLPQGSPAQFEERTLITEPNTYIEDRDIATNYIRGLMSAPTVDTQEGIAMWIAMSILRDRFFLELRTKRGLTYAPGAFYSTGVLKNPYNGLYVSTLDPKQSMEVMVEELDKIKMDGFETTELKNEKQTFLTAHFMGQQSTGAQARMLGMGEIQGGWEKGENFLERVNDVSLEEMNAVFDKYSSTISWTYLGKADMVNTEDFLQPGDVLEVEKKMD